MTNNFQIKYNKEELSNYWNNYYLKKSKVLPNSDFSLFVKPKLQQNSTLIDIGCGDGRDSIYFSQNKVFTTGVDISDEIIKKNNLNLNKYLEFKVLDLENISNLNEKYDFAYCRFLFHAINENIEDELFNWFKKNINSKIFIETRVKDSKQKIIKESHYRRYFKEEYFVDKVKKAGFEILYKESSRNFSKYKNIYNVKDVNHDPLLLRMVIA